MATGIQANVEVLSFDQVANKRMGCFAPFYSANGYGTVSSPGFARETGYHVTFAGPLGSCSSGPLQILCRRLANRFLPVQLESVLSTKRVNDLLAVFFGLFARVYSMSGPVC